MACIEIIYESSSFCSAYESDYCMQCHTNAAQDLGCPCYWNGSTDDKANKIGECKHAEIRYTRLGWVGKRYEIGEPEEDYYNLHLNCVAVRLGNKWYERCVKVVLNGKIIFNNYDDEED